MPKVVISSTDHYQIETEAIANYESDVTIGKRKYSRKNTVYVKPVSIILHGNAWRKLYAEMQHINGDCEASQCGLCKKQKKEYGV